MGNFNTGVGILIILCLSLVGLFSPTVSRRLGSPIQPLDERQQKTTQPQTGVQQLNIQDIYTGLQRTNKLIEKMKYQQTDQTRMLQKYLKTLADQVANNARNHELQGIEILKAIQQGEHGKIHDDCSYPKKVGLCKGNFTRFYYDNESEGCREFVFGGCDANKNNFETREECMLKCLAGMWDLSGIKSDDGSDEN